MSTPDLDALRIREARARLERAAAEHSCRLSAQRTADGSFRAVLTPLPDGGEVYFALVPPDAAYLSLSLVLVVDEAFFHERVEGILLTTARYEVCASIGRDDRLEAGEVYLNLSQRLYLPALDVGLLSFTLENLRAARRALAAEFP